MYVYSLLHTYVYYVCFLTQSFHVILIIVSGPNIKTTIAILNCLLARQFCFEDSSCSAILEIIPRVCGPELGELFLHIPSFLNHAIATT